MSTSITIKKNTYQGLFVYGLRSGSGSSRGTVFILLEEVEDEFKGIYSDIF
jgi:hypothetical protein